MRLILGAASLLVVLFMAGSIKYMADRSRTVAIEDNYEMMPLPAYQAWTWDSAEFAPSEATALLARFSPTKMYRVGKGHMTPLVSIVAAAFIHEHWLLVCSSDGETLLVNPDVITEFKGN